MIALKPWIIWLILAVLFAIIEIFTPGFVVLTFSFGAILALIVSLFSKSLILQLLAFAAGSFYFFIYVRKFFLKLLTKNNGNIKTNIDSLIGKKAIVTQKIPGGIKKGYVKVGPEQWLAISITGESIEKDELVKVVKIEGNTLYVEKIKEV